MKFTSAFLISLLLAAPLLAQSRQPTTVSIVQLIANPKAYQGKSVRLIGFVSIRFEGKAVYLHEDDYKHGIKKNGLWLALSGSKSGHEHSEFHEKYVLIEGTFDVGMKGHRGAYSGAIKNIKRMQAIEARSDARHLTTACTRPESGYLSSGTCAVSQLRAGG